MAGCTFLWACILLILFLCTVASAPIESSTSSHPPRSTRTRLTERQLEDSSIFSRLLDNPAPTPTYIDPEPDVPRIPNIFVPLAVRPEKERDRPVIHFTTGTIVPTSSIPLPPPTSTASHSSKHPRPSSSHQDKGGSYLSRPITGSPTPLGDTPEEIIARCKADMSPSLPSSFIPEVGVVRLFRKSSFKAEGAVLRGCGCIPLQSPLVIESFVGSRNHSFVFYSNARCEGKPYYQRFKEHYDMEPSMLTASVRIVQGVLPPISNKTDVF